MRLLHTMIRVNDLAESLHFYTDVLGMKLLRRHDYESGRFTLAFVGYGDEDSSAVIELTKLRAPCATQDIYGPDIKREIYDKQARDGDHTSPRWALGGFYAAVVQAGLVRVGDEIMLESELA